MGLSAAFIPRVRALALLNRCSLSAAFGDTLNGTLHANRIEKQSRFYARVISESRY